MDSYRSRARRGIANSETSGWKSVGFHAMVVWEITYAIILSSPQNAIYSSPAIKHWVKRFEKHVYVSAKDKEDYHSNMARWIVSIGASSQIPGRLTAFSNPTKTASSSSGGNERNAYINWQEQLYNRAQKLIGMFCSKFPNWCRLAIILQQQRRHSAPQHLKISHIVKYNLIMRMLENVVYSLNVSRGQINPALKKKLDRLEKLLISILCPRNVSPHHQGPSSSHQQAGGSQSELPLMSSQSSHLSKRKSPDSGSEEEEQVDEARANGIHFFNTEA
ncbi:hypothetical protein K1719_013806 [Acacia pycnantha]|nr:hypothetical protein K1719_013806 [Acacia pycnantha]